MVYQQQRMSPMDIHFAHDSIGRQFKNGQLLEDVFRLLACDINYINKIPNIPVMVNGGHYWAADGNRRLYLYRSLHEFGALKHIHVDVVPFNPYKFQQAHTTENGGKSVRVRGQKNTDFRNTLKRIWIEYNGSVRRPSTGRKNTDAGGVHRASLASAYGRQQNVSTVSQSYDPSSYSAQGVSRRSNQPWTPGLGQGFAVHGGTSVHGNLHQSAYNVYADNSGFASERPQQKKPDALRTQHQGSSRDVGFSYRPLPTPVSTPRIEEPASDPNSHFTVPPPQQEAVFTDNERRPWYKYLLCCS